MGGPTSNHATLRDKFELEKFRSKVVKNVTETESSSPSNFDQKQKTMEMEEIVKHMKHVPSYLERGKPIQDQALSFGVMDWAQLEKWQSRHHKQDSRTKAKVRVDFKKEIRVDDVSSSSTTTTMRKQALFQTTVKNDCLLFTFAVENNMEVLAATVTSLTSSVKDKNKSRLYTFFTVHEVKKNLSYVPNITAQMKVSNSHINTREFVLYSVNPNVQPQEELEAIVVKFSRNTNGDGNRESFETTVILPGGSHGVPSKGVPSPLVDRWRSGGVCDCGGWDVGCRLRTLGGSRSDKVHLTSCQFNLFFQEEVENKRPLFSLSPLKEGIFSIEYNSSLSPLQAFSICISYVESRKLTQHTELRTHTREAAPLVYTPIPRIKRDACKCEVKTEALLGIFS
ncbi:hypothetical protein L1987_21282 [Smallanthus sonchifolius]|uniref:Uncharacterized protein n=1 Tax=Smallanthus sonchifolius TaxID=185202 RepID=A0ACB9IX26_9ASTR|nr:hypothetical protein L1987_21282 [Smallanthus sonchifolius]